MIWYILGGFALCYILTAVLYFIEDYTGIDMLYDYFYAPLYAILYVVLFIPIFLWHFIRHIFKPTSRTALDKFLEAFNEQKRPGPVWYPITKNFGLFYNGKDCKPWLRYYLSRIK